MDDILMTCPCISTRYASCCGQTLRQFSLSQRASCRQKHTQILPIQAQFTCKCQTEQCSREGHNMRKGCNVRLAQRHTLLRAIMPLATAFVKTATALQLVSSMTVMSVASLSWAGAFPSASPERAGILAHPCQKSAACKSWQKRMLTTARKMTQRI